MALAESVELVLASQPPWRDHACRLISWWDVEKFSAAAFYGIGLLMESALREVANHTIDVIPEKECGELQRTLSELEVLCKLIGLTTPAKLAANIREDLPGKKCFLVVQDVITLQKIVAWEMQDELFMYIPRHRSSYYTEPLKGWEEVVKTFPRTILDIEEASKCLACERYAGTVFHMMLVAEVGAIEVGKLIEINDPKVGWPSTIREMKRVVYKEQHQNLRPAEQKYRALAGQLLPIMESMEQGWRHKISHVDNKIVLLSGEFSPQIAEEILIATRSFMRRLATDLP
jgi:hypothetical protein